MAKETGLGAGFFIDGIDLSGDIGSLGTISKSMAVLPVTGIDKYAVERRPAILNGRLLFNSWFNPSAAQQHAALKNVPRTDRLVSYVHKLNVLGTPVASMVAKQVSYDPKRGNDGSLAIDIETLSNAQWLDWGYSLTTGKRTDTTATNGTGVDFSAAAAFGLQAYIQVTAFTGTNCTVKLQGSSDNGVGDAFADITAGAFAVVTSAPTYERIATARNQAVERYIRVITSGTFSSITFLVAVTVNRADLTI